MHPPYGQTLAYPRTYHLAGSLQGQRRDARDDVALDALPGDRVVLEEKLDGTLVSIQLDTSGQLVFHSRNTRLDGGPDQRQFALLKRWAWTHYDALFKGLDGPNRILFGEWVYAKHTVYYDALEHHLLEFDLFDRREGLFWSTARRHRLWDRSPVRSVPVLYEGPADGVGALDAHLVRSRYKTPKWREALERAAERAGCDPARALAETDPSDLPEGIYVKAETADATVGRFKYIRAGFLDTLRASGTHWRDRPEVVHGLREGVDVMRA